MKIARVLAREIFDSSGYPTVQCEIRLDNGSSVSSSVSSGKTQSPYEGVEIRDGGERLFGKGVLRSIENIEIKIAPLLLGKKVSPLEMDLAIIDLDGTAHKSHLGTHAMLAVSMALYKAQALVEGLELYELIAFVAGLDTVAVPLPMFSLLDRADHAENKLAVSECMIIPIGAPTFRVAFEMGVMLNHELGKIFKKYNKIVLTGPHGGYAPLYTAEREALDMLMEALCKVTVQYGYKSIIALDAKASGWYSAEHKGYFLHDTIKTAKELVAWYAGLAADYPIYALADGLDQNDLEGWHILTDTFQNKIQIIGDDLFASSPYRIADGLKQHITDTVIIKPQQVGTITEVLQTIVLCKNHDITTIVSSSFAETEDAFIADLAVGISAHQIKAGGCTHAENIAKYNRLLAIEDSLAINLL